MGCDGLWARCKWVYYGTGSSVYIWNGQSTQRILAWADVGYGHLRVADRLLMFLLWQPKQGHFPHIVGENKTAKGEQDADIYL